MALINTVADIKKHNSAISVGVEMENVQSFIDDAIESHIIPRIGRAQFDELVAARTTLTGKQIPAFNFIQKSCVGFLLAYYAVSGAVTIDNTGIFVVKGTNKAPASDKKLMSLRKDSFLKGYGALEQAVDYLEASLADFPLYLASDQHRKNRALLINSSTEFQDAGVNIGGNGPLYQVLKAYQVDAENTYINNILGDDLNETLRAAILSGTTTEVQKKLLEKLRMPLACLTMMEAIPYLSISIDSDGIYQLSDSVGGMAANVETKSSASDNRVAIAMYSLQTKAERQIETLRKWLKEHQAEFTDYTVPTAVILNSDPTSNMYFL
ncbi:MAG TPA: DUF6712 family protein [Pedobacter sp.]